MKEFLVTRVATRNPDIEGRTLYLTVMGFWTLNKDNARKFDSRTAAEEQCRKDLEGCEVVQS